MWRALLPSALLPFALLGMVVASSGPSARPAAISYELPVAAPVSDPFRPPATAYGPGNRGLEFATGPGAEVRAAAPGTVSFSGSVAGSRYVTIQHPDRARTTYGPLAEVRVAVGEEVGAGAGIGTAAGPLLWTLRLGEAYLDPALALAASGQGGVRLVPVREGLGGG